MVMIASAPYAVKQRIVAATIVCPVDHCRHRAMCLREGDQR